MKIYLYESYVNGKMDELFISNDDCPRIVAQIHPKSLPMGDFTTIGHRRLGSFFLEGSDHHTCSMLFVHMIKTVLFSALIEYKSFDLLRRAEENPLSALFDIWKRLNDDQRLEWLYAFVRTDERFSVDFAKRMP